MTFVVTKRPWTRQPQGAAWINWANPINKDLLLAVDKGRQIWPPGSAVKTGTREQIQIDVPAGGFRTTGFGSTLGAGTSDSLKTTVTTHNALRTIVFWTFRRGDGGGNLGRVYEKSSVELVYILSGLVNYLRATGANPFSGWTFPNTVGSTGTLDNLAITHDTSQLSAPLFYQKGNPVAATSSQGATSGIWNTNSEPYIIGNRISDGARNWDGTIGPLFLFDRILSREELQTLYFAPWQLFRPANSPVFYSLPAAAPTLSAATVTSITTTGATPQVYVQF